MLTTSGAYFVLILVVAISVFKRHSLHPMIHLCVVTFAVIQEIIYIKYSYSCILIIKNKSRIVEQHIIAVVVPLRVIIFQYSEWNGIHTVCYTDFYRYQGVIRSFISKKDTQHHAKKNTKRQLTVDKNTIQKTKV